MKAEHTKGDWTLVDSLMDHEGQQIMSGDRVIAITVTQDRSHESDEEKANAKLLVNAPQVRTAAIKAIEALLNVPLVGAIYGQQHSDTHMQAMVDLKLALAGDLYGAR